MYCCDLLSHYRHGCVKEKRVVLCSLRTNFDKKQEGCLFLAPQAFGLSPCPPISHHALQGEQNIVLLIYLELLLLRWYCTSPPSGSSTVVTIGGVRKSVEDPKNPELVPRDYLPKSIPNETMKDLKWMLQKDLLGQDIFLLGRPGPLRRTLAQQYLELTKREMEYVSLTRDTTESDLKQRREIQSGTAFYVDQSAVRAATEGRVLVLEGIEKVERNVLPVLNNLLENREMHLEDGRLLIPSNRYDALLADHGQEVRCFSTNHSWIEFLPRCWTCGALSACRLTSASSPSASQSLATLAVPLTLP